MMVVLIGTHNHDDNDDSDGNDNDEISDYSDDDVLKNCNDNNR